MTLVLHGIVCRVFNGPPPPDCKDIEYSADHIDRDRSKNYAWNLRWADNPTQLTNRGVKRFSDDPNAPLMNPPKRVKMKRNKPDKAIDSSCHAYNLYMGDDGFSLEEIGEIIAKRSKPVQVHCVMYLAQLFMIYF